MHKKLFIEHISNFTKNNLRHIDHVDIRITNPKKLGFMYPKIYEATLAFKKNDMSVYQRFQSNDIEDLLSSASNFISKEIKV